jgi:hypothetical protein
MSSEIIRNDPFATLGKQSASAVKSIGKTDVLKSFRVYNGSELFVGIEVFKLNFMTGDGRIFSIHMAFLIRIRRPYSTVKFFSFSNAASPLPNIRVFQRLFVARPDGLCALGVADANSEQGGPRRVESKSNRLLILS